jgi:hypothetical protein
VGRSSSKSASSSWSAVTTPAPGRAVHPSSRARQSVTSIPWRSPANQTTPTRVIRKYVPDSTNKLDVAVGEIVNDFKVCLADLDLEQTDRADTCTHCTDWGECIGRISRHDWKLLDRSGRESEIVLLPDLEKQDGHGPCWWRMGRAVKVSLSSALTSTLKLMADSLPTTLRTRHYRSALDLL